MLPDNLKTWCQMLGEAQAQGYSYEQAMQRIDDSPVREALSYWHLAVAASMSTPPRQP